MCYNMVDEDLQRVFVKAPGSSLMRDNLGLGPQCGLNVILAVKVD